jgi:HK97 family phage major capsid protein
VFRAAGPRVVPFSGSMFLPFFATGSTATYQGENQAIVKSEPTFGQHQMQERKLTNLVPISNEMLRMGGPQTEAYILQDMIQAIAEREDLAFLRGDGTSYTPKGLKTWKQTTNAANGTINVTNVTADLAKCPAGIEALKVALTRPNWFVSARTKWYLRSLRTTNGEYAFPEVQQNMLLGFPLSVSVQIPNNLGGGTDESEVYLANMDDMQLGQSTSVMVDSFPGGAYDSGGGTIVSGISNDQTVLRVIEAHDLMARKNGKEIAMLTAVKWA